MSKKVFTLAQLATLTQSKLIGDPNKAIHNVADLESACGEDASFLGNPNYEKAMRASKAGVVFISPSTPLENGRNFLLNENPSRAFQQTVEAFLGESLKSATGFPGIHPTAIIHPTAKIGSNPTIAPHAVIEADVTIGDNATIGAGAFIGKDVTIGNNSHIHPNVTIRERCEIGNRVTIQPGAVIGSCGFGYTTDPQGVHTKLNQVGIVKLEDDVEIGANTTIDRSRFKATIVGKGTKIDNLVQLGHGVTIGNHCIIVSQTGIAGSTKVGNNVVIAGQVAIAGHLSIADRVVISARTGISKSLTEPGPYGGVPAMPMQEHNRTTVMLRNIAKYVQQIKELDARVRELEQK